ncbi:MAG TPA: hypothetical protein VGE32_10145 [Cellvibrio sp.]
MTALLKPTITYKLADLLAVATEQKQHHEQEAAKVAGNNNYALSHGFHGTMAQGAQRNIDTLEAFRQAGVETVSAEYPIAEGAQRVFTNEDTSLSGQLRKGQIKPVSP